jgi:Fe-S oxidoreductase
MTAKPPGTTFGTMQTNFSLAQLADPHMRESEKILRSCVHCGFCTATCPTYLLLGDELDSPRGRIYLIKDMLEKGKPATQEIVKHIDRCLSCLSCMTTCPSGVHYMHLVDHARAYIEKTYVRDFRDKFVRALLVASNLRFSARPSCGVCRRFLPRPAVCCDYRLLPIPIRHRAS